MVLLRLKPTKRKHLDAAVSAEAVAKNAKEASIKSREAGKETANPEKKAETAEKKITTKIRTQAK